MLRYLLLKHELTRRNCATHFYCMAWFLIQFYRLPLEFLSQAFAVATILFMGLCGWLSSRRWFRYAVGVVLVLWFYAALWITVLNRTPGSLVPPELIPFHSFRELICTGNNEIVRTVYMNLILFYPAGLLMAAVLPAEWSWRSRLLVAAVVFGLFSCCIEYTQYRWTLGEPEIDDVLSNTLGAILGTIPFRFQEQLYRPRP